MLPPPSQVVEDVVKKVRNHFISAGVDESVLRELQSEWQTGIRNSRCVTGCPEDRPPQPPDALLPVSPTGSPGGRHGSLRCALLSAQDAGCEGDWVGRRRG